MNYNFRNLQTKSGNGGIKMNSCPLNRGYPCRKDCAWFITMDELCAINIIAQSMDNILAEMYKR